MYKFDNLGVVIVDKREKVILNFIWRHSSILLKRFKSLKKEDCLLLDSHYNRSANTELPYSLFSLHNGTETYINLNEWCFKIKGYDGTNSGSVPLKLDNKHTEYIMLQTANWSWNFWGWNIQIDDIQRLDMFRLCITSMRKCDCGKGKSCSSVLLDVYTLVRHDILGHLLSLFSLKNLKNLFIGKIYIDGTLYLIRSKNTLRLDTETGFLSLVAEGEVSYYLDTGRKYDDVVKSLIFGG